MKGGDKDREVRKPGRRNRDWRGDTGDEEAREMMCRGQGSETGGGEGNPMERMRRHRRSHRGAARARGAHTGRNWRGGAGTQGRCPPTRPYLV